MKPLQRGYIDPEQERHVIDDFIEQWRRGDAEVRKRFPAETLNAARACITSFMQDIRLNETIWVNNTYQVNVREWQEPIGKVMHISVKRLDKQPIHDWRDLQAIKNQIVGPECEAVELYPAESRKVDSANQFHLWACPDPKFRFPFGFQDRLVSDAPFGNSVQRPLLKRKK